MNNAIYEYYQAIQDGSVTVGRWIRLWYEKIIHDLEAGAYAFSPKAANKAIRFIENFCHHHEGAKAPQLIRLELWQRALISVLFGIVDDKGVRWFREAFVVVSRKNGKTLLAAALAEYMAFMDGEYGARVYFVAPKLEQARLCYDAFYQMLRQEPELSALAKRRRTDVYIDRSNSSAQPVAFSARKSDGLNPHLAVCDELAAWAGDAGLKQYEVLKSAQGARRQPLILGISTAGYVNNGIFDELYKRATAVILGSSRERRLAPFLYVIDDLQKWNDINELQKSNPNLGVSIGVDYLLEEIAVAEGSLSKKNEFITKYAGIKQNSASAFLSWELVEATGCDELKPEDLRHTYCVGGIDLSQTTDLTSACVVIEKNGVLHVLAKFWMPANKVEELSERDNVPYGLMAQAGLLGISGDNFVDYHDCFNWFVELVEKYEILPLQVGYDRYSAQYLVQDMKAYGFHMDDVYQGFNLTPVIREFEGLMKDGKIRTGTNGLLKSHLLNVAVKADIESQKIRIIKIDQTAHIDGAAALIDALTVRQKWSGEIGEQLKNNR